MSWMSIEEAGTLDKLLPPLEMTEPKPALELQRFCELYAPLVENNSDPISSLSRAPMGTKEPHEESETTP